MSHTANVARLLLVLLLLPVLFAPTASADTVRRIVHPDGSVEYTNIPASQRARPSTRKQTVYRYRNDEGAITFSSNRPSAEEFDVIRFDCYACKLSSNVNWRTTRLYREPFQQEIQTAAQKYRIDPALVRAVIHAESAFNPQAVSSRGAQGLMQLMPGTAEELGVRNAMNVADNIRGGAHYLAKMLRLHNNDIELATAAYNAGPGTVSRYGGIPPYAETQAYVERVAILHERYRSVAAN